MTYKADKDKQRLSSLCWSRAANHRKRVLITKEWLLNLRCNSEEILNILAVMVMIDPYRVFLRNLVEVRKCGNFRQISILKHLLGLKDFVGISVASLVAKT